jgi:hypothetical protein
VLKQRIAGRHGHLSNEEAAQSLPEMLCDRLRWVVCYHLSETNNLPGLAAAGVAEVLDREGSAAAVMVSEQDRPGQWIEVPATDAPAPAIPWPAPAFADRAPAPRRRRRRFHPEPSRQLGFDFAFGED